MVIKIMIKIKMIIIYNKINDYLNKQVKTIKLIQSKIVPLKI